MTVGSAAKHSRAKRRRPLWWRAVRWLCRLTFLLVVLVIALALALPYITDSSLVKSRIRRAIARTLNGAAVELETLRLAPLSDRLLVLEGLRLAPPGGPERPLLAVEKVVCRWSPLDLLGRKLVLTHVEVSGVSVLIAEGEAGWNFEALLSPYPKDLGEKGLRIPDLAGLSLPLAVEIGSLSVGDVTVKVERRSGERVEVGPMSVLASGRFDGRLRGTAGAWCAVEKLSVGLAQPVEAEFETGLVARMSFSRKELEKATLQAEFSTHGARANVAGVPSAPPISSQGAISATVDLARLAIPEADASFTVPGVLEDRLAIKVTREEGWKVWADNSLSVDFLQLGSRIEDALITLWDSTEAASRAQLRSLSLAGAAEVRSLLEGSISPGPPLRVQAVVDNQITGSDIGIASLLLLRQGDGLEVAAELSGLDVLWHYAAQVAIKDKLTVETTDDFTLGIEALRLAAGDVAQLNFRDIVVSGTAADELPDPVNVALSATVEVGSLAVESPRFGRVEFPAELAIELTGRNLADAADSIVVLERASGSLGRAVPHYRLEGVVEGYGMKSLRLGGEAVLHFAEVLALADGLSDSLKDVLRGAEADGSATAQFDVAGAVPRAESDAQLDVSLSVTAALPRTGFWLGELGASAEQVNADIACSFALGPDYRPLAVRGRTSVSLGSTAAVAREATLGLDGADLTISAASGSDLVDVSCQFQTSARRVTASLPQGGEGGMFEFSPFDIEASASARVNIESGDLALEDVDVRVPGVMILSDAMLGASEFGAKQLSARAALELPDLGAIIALLPEDLMQALPEVSGAVTLKGSAEGNVPLVAPIVTALREGAPWQTIKENIVSSLRSGEPWPELRLFPLSRFYEKGVPLSASGALELRDLSVRHRISDDLSVAVQDITAQTNFRLRGGDVEGEFTVMLPAVLLSPLASPLEDFRFFGRCELSEFDRLRVEDVALSALREVVTVGMEGEVSGLSLLRLVPTPASLLSSLSASAAGQMRVEPEAISALEGWAGQGGAGADFSMELVGGESLEVEGAGWLDELSLTLSGLLSVDGLTARVPLKRSWRILTSQQAEEGELLSKRVVEDGAAATGELPLAARQDAGSAWKQQGLELALDRLVEPAESLRVRSVSVLGHKVLDGAAVDVRFEGENLRVPRITLGVLGGRVVGRIGAWRADDAYAIYAESEFDGLDVRRMLPPELRDIKGDTSLSGNMRAEVGLQLAGAEGEAPAVSPIKEISAQLDVTHIGSEALDRALLVIDPEAENPSIVEMRGKLSLASPRRVRVDLRRGFVSGEVELQGLLSGLVSSYSVPRFSITEAFASETAGEYLSVLSRLMSLARVPLEALGAECIVLTGDGIEFRR